MLRLVAVAAFVAVAAALIKPHKKKDDKDKKKQKEEEELSDCPPWTRSLCKHTPPEIVKDWRQDLAEVERKHAEYNRELGNGAVSETRPGAPLAFSREQSRQMEGAAGISAP